MKIGIYLADISRQIGGGSRFQQMVVGELLATQSAHQFCLLAHASDTPFGPPEILIDQSFEPTRVRNLLKRAGVLDTKQGSVLPVLREHEIDLIYSPHPNTLTCDIPFVVTCWDLQHRVRPFFPEVSTSGWSWESREEHYRVALRRAAAVIAGTDHGKQEITQFYGVASERVSVIPYPVPETLLEQQASRPAWAPSKPFVFYPAQFWPHKNHITILHSLRRLQDVHGTEIAVVFPGSAQPDNACTLQYTKNSADGLNVDAHFPGFVTDQELKWLYENCLALVFASLLGPDNLPPLEAMSLGCPVIASSIPGAEEQLQEGALLVEPMSEQAMADAIQSLVTSGELREQLVRRGLQRVSSLRQTSYAASLLQLFDQLALYRRCWP